MGLPERDHSIPMSRTDGALEARGEAWANSEQLA